MMIRRLAQVVAAGVLVLALAACGSDSKKGAAPSGSGAGGSGTAADKVEVKDFAFSPKSITVKAGTTVTFTFADSTDHNVQAVEPADAFPKTPDLQGGKTATVTFAKAGTVQYRCGIHNSMTGTVVVTA